MHRIIFVLLFSLQLVVTGHAQVIFPRTPAPSPDGKTIVFSFQGDLWKVASDGGEAVRLTAHPAYDYLPAWSPDGKRLAFSSDRYGNEDVFVLDFETRQVTQLTYYSNYDRVTGWTPDGKAVLFYSRRNFYYHRVPVTYTVPITGGTPTELLPTYAYRGRLSPDGRYFVFVKGVDLWFRKHYRGSSNMDLWLYDFKTQTYKQLTTFEGNDLDPVWAPDSRTIYFSSDRDGTYNIYRMNVENPRPRQITFFKEDGVRAPNIAANGSLLAFERGFDLWVMTLPDGKPRKLSITLPMDFVQNPIDYRTFTRDATEMQISPDGEKIAFVVRGEIFVMKSNGQFLNQITNSPWRERDIAWAPNSDTLVYVSDVYGQRDVFLVTSGDPQEKSLYKTTRFKTVRLTHTDVEEYKPRFSPDGKSLAYLRGIGDLVIRNLQSGKERTVVKSWNELHYEWSPDSRWIAYSMFDAEYNRDIYILNLKSGKSVNVSMHPDNDNYPHWSPDGKKLAFISRRTTDNNEDIYLIFLRKADDVKSDAEWEEYFEHLKKDKRALQHPEVSIDFTDIHRRIRRVTRLPGTESNFAWSPDGRYLVFDSNTEGKTDLYKIQWNGKKLQRLTKGGHAPEAIQWNAKKKAIFYLKKGGSIASISPEGKNGKTIAFRAQIKIDHPREQRQKFLEAWQALNDYFYDPNFHGVNWNAVKKKYLPIAEAVKTLRDFNDIMFLMVGELNASHLGIYGPRGNRPIQSGILGLRFDSHYRGKGLKISEIIPDGPCDQPDARAKVGEVLVAINDTPITPTTNIHALLWNTIGKPTRLSLEGKSGKSTYQRTIIVKPVSYRKFLDLEYRRWVEEKRQLVHRLSHNKLGYIHIRAMDPRSLETFETELYAEAHDKDALVIDVRNNGGGWITDYLLAMLMVKPHAVTVPRNGPEGYPQSRRPLYAWTKPIIVLCNEFSFSNAEIFSHAIKTLGRGKVVGYPTGGFVISTGAIDLIDGATFRIPFRGWYVATNHKNMENNGAVPDIIVQERPEDYAAHRDRQLQRAVEVLLQEMKQ